jgi:hypothetical protein
VTVHRYLASAISRGDPGEITVDIFEGRHFNGPSRGYSKNLLLFFHRSTLAEITPKRTVGYKAKRYADGMAPANINRELACMKKAFLVIRDRVETTGGEVNQLYFKSVALIEIQGNPCHKLSKVSF